MSAARGLARSARPGRGPGRWPLVAALIAISALLAPAAVRDAAGAIGDATRRWAWARDPATPWALTATGARRGDPMDVVVYVDESGSTAGSDPGGARWRQTAELVRFFDRARSGDAIAVGAFADTAEPVPPPGPPAAVDLHHRPGVDVGTDTSFVPVAEQLNAVIGDHRPGRRRVAVLVTDGAGPDVADALARLDPGIEVWVLGLDQNGAWSEQRPRWEPRARSVGTVGDAASIAAGQAELVGALTGQHVTIEQVPPPQELTP